MSNQLSPLNEAQLKSLQNLTTNLTKEQAIWLNGYIQGFSASTFASADPETSPATVERRAATPLTILYGTHTGRSEKIANEIHSEATTKNLESTLLAMDQYKPRNLKNEKNLLIIVSTHGEGEPPVMADDFHEFVTGKRAPKLTGLNFSVLALGDKSYKHFCQTGIDIQQALLKAGASEIAGLVKCDVDYQPDADQWKQEVFNNLKSEPVEELPTTSQDKSTGNETITYSRKNPYEATILDKVRITGRESDKEVYHLEISLENSGIKYEPGDSLGVIAQNPGTLVDEILSTLKDDGSESLDTHAGKISFREALLHHHEITILTRDLIEKYAEKTNHKEVKKLIKDDQKLETYLYGHDVLDLLNEFPSKITAVDFLKILRPLPPRLYSISSSQEAVGEEVHITVSKVLYENKGRQRLGACSGHLAEHKEVDDQILIYIEKNPNFRLPANGSPIIMVGAGTGIAPYRAFIQQREATGHKGKTWLFFGERRFSSDFLYQTEWQKYLKEGYLGKIDLAFSRDQKEKIYVQHKLQKQQKKIFKWLENDGVFYLCGDMKKMAKDVEATLLSIIEKQGGMTPERAKGYLKKLKKERRFQADVY
jgi:sulfite reductase (NADPH) flavoprotein alpha-component